MSASPSPDGPGDAAGPDGGADISAAQIMVALRVSRSTFYQNRKQGRIAAPDRPTPGGQGRYSPELAAEIVRKANREVPRAWGAK